MFIRIVCAVTALLVSTGVHAQVGSLTSPECIVGGIAGGLLGNQVGKGNGNKAAVALGSVIGCAAGSRIQQNPSAPHVYMQPQYSYPVYPPADSATEQYLNRSYTWRDGRPFAPQCFSQWMGGSRGHLPMSAQGRQALRNATSILGQSHESSQQALLMHHTVQQRLHGLQMDAQNPQTRLIVGTAIDAQIEHAQREERRVARQYKEAYDNHNAVVEQTLRACEYSAARGEDVSEFSSLLAYMDPLPTPNKR